MPREFFQNQHATPEWDGPKATLGWDRAPDVQLGVVVNPIEAEKWLDEALADVDLSDEQRTLVIAALTAPESPIFGWHTNLGRSEVNRLIRTLRRARDAAFGADA